MHVKECKKKFKCEKCDKKLIYMGTIRNYKVHVKICNGDNFKCPHCQKEFTEKKKCIDHVSFCERRYHCNRCNRMFPTKELLRCHSKTEHIDYQCDVCGALFLCPKNLEEHTKTTHKGKEN